MAGRRFGKILNPLSVFTQEIFESCIYEVRMGIQGSHSETIEAQTGPSWGWLIFALANFLLICSALLFHWFTLLESMAFVSGMVLGLACFRAEEAWLTSGNILKVRNLVWIVKSYDLSELKWIDVHAKNSIVLWIGEQVVSLSTDTSKRINLDIS